MHIQRKLNILMILSLSCWLSSNLSNARAAEESTRFSLNLVENDTKDLRSSKWEQRQELLERIADAIRIGKENLVNSITLIRNVIADQTKQLSNEALSNLAPIVTKTDKLNPRFRFLTPAPTAKPIVLLRPVKRETIRLENDTSQAILERRKPDNIHQALNSFLNPVPIVDKIKEEEKYGNTGDRFIGISRGFINAFENLSNFLNMVVELPISTAKQMSRKITESLNQLGAQLVGLQ